MSTHEENAAKFFGSARRPKLLICGLARHGKDTAAEYLCNTYGLSFQSSSEAALDTFLLEKLNRDRRWAELPAYADRQAAFEDRVNLRQYWHEAIKEYNTPDKARLAKDIMRVNDVYVGMRCKDELAAARAAGIFDAVIWVDARDRLGVTETAESITIQREMCDYFVRNNISLENFHHKLDICYQDTVNRLK